MSAARNLRSPAWTRAMLVPALFVACTSSANGGGEDPVSECALGEMRMGSACVTACGDGVDNDGDGWIDARDPDCDDGTTETGRGTSLCNDGLDNDGDGSVDSEDAECDAASGDEVLGTGGCVDVCYVTSMRSNDDATCELWDASQQQWVPFADEPGRNRSRAYNMWIRKWLSPAGGLAKAMFTDGTWQELDHNYGAGDSAIWTGTYLASQVFRYQATGDPDALDEIERIVPMLHDWWHIPGSPGALARYAAPADSAPHVLAQFDPGEARHHFGTPHGGKTWNWIGDVSRDQYQGVVLGLSLAYDVVEDPDLKEMIRADIFEFVMQLVEPQIRSTRIEIDGIPFSTDLDYRYAVFTEAEFIDGKPTIVIDTDNLGETTFLGFQEFMPNPSVLLRQLPGLGGIPDIPRSGSSIMLMSYMAVALHVSDGVEGYEERRAAVEELYATEFEDWLSVAKLWQYFGECGDKYYGIHIAYQPAMNFARLEADPIRNERFRREVLYDRLWSTVADHKNVFFAYATAAYPPDGVETQDIIAAHNAQLALFPEAPRARLPVDHSNAMIEDPDCPGNALEALDLDRRPAHGYTWQLNPWLMQTPDLSSQVELGADFEMAYWLGRAQGFVQEDKPNVCLRWHR